MELVHKEERVGCKRISVEVYILKNTHEEENKGIGHIGVDDRCRVMFVGVVLISPHETITRPLGRPRVLKACVTC